MSWGNAPIAAPQPEPGPNDLSAQEWLNKREGLLLAWDAAKNVLDAAKNSEMEARKAVADFAFPIDSRVRGKTNNQDLPNGFTLKLGDKINHSIKADAKTIGIVEESVIPTISNEAVFKFERIIKMKHEFSIGEYNKLDMDNPADVKLKAEIDKLIEAKPGAPTLEIKPPKDTL